MDSVPWLAGRLAQRIVGRYSANGSFHRDLFPSGLRLTFKAQIRNPMESNRIPQKQRLSKHRTPWWQNVVPGTSRTWNSIGLCDSYKILRFNCCQEGDRRSAWISHYHQTTLVSNPALKRRLEHAKDLLQQVVGRHVLGWKSLDLSVKFGWQRFRAVYSATTQYWYTGNFAGSVFDQICVKNMSPDAK